MAEKNLLNMTKLIILDRDGVINEDSDNYIRSVDEWIPVPGSIKAIAELSKAGYTITVATNQSGLARGYFQESELTAMHNKMNMLVKAEGGNIETILFCPHGPDDDCECRKPKAGMMLQLLSEHNANASETWVIGDSLRDLQAGLNSGCKAALVKTGKGERTLKAIEEKEPHLKSIPLFENLKEFSEQLLSESL